MARMNKLWTTDLPKENGFYWVKFSDDEELSMIRVDSGEIVEFGLGDYIFATWEKWQDEHGKGAARSVSPIPPPGFERGTFGGVPFLMEKTNGGDR